MLSVKQKIILKILNDNCGSQGSILISKEVISLLCQPLKRISAQAVEKTLISLSIGGYVEYVKTYKKAEEVYCITITEKGKLYRLEERAQVQNFVNKLAVTVLCALLSFVIGRILFAVFT